MDRNDLEVEEWDGPRNERRLQEDLANRTPRIGPLVRGEFFEPGARSHVPRPVAYRIPQTAGLTPPTGATLA